MKHVESIESILYEANINNIEDTSKQLYEELILIGNASEIEKILSKTPPLGDEDLCLQLLNFFSSKNKNYNWLIDYIKNNSEYIDTNTTLFKTSKIINNSIRGVLNE